MGVAKSQDPSSESEIHLRLPCWNERDSVESFDTRLDCLVGTVNGSMHPYHDQMKCVGNCTCAIDVERRNTWFD